MPYFVYRVTRERALTALEVFEEFKPAKDFCRQQRKAQARDDSDNIRLIFAEHKKEAEMLLREKHKPSGPLEEWEG